MTVEFGILGPLSVSVDGKRISIGAGKQSALLAILLLHANEVVSTDRLIDELWGGSAPETAAKALQVHVSQLRTALEPGRQSGDPGRLLLTRAPGYMLALEPEQLDLARFDRLLREGREASAAGDPERGAECLSKALSLWRGPALADFTYLPFAQAEASRLDEVRVAALEDRIEADLARGRHAEVAAELESLVAAEPLRERPRGQLMLALYRSGRQAEALDAYRSAREALVNDLGIEPGRDLQRLHQAILDQDPELDLAPVVASAAAVASAPPGAPEGREPQPEAGGFVGREREIADLVGGLDRAFAGAGGVYMLGGEPGIGKSRLADEVSAIARTRDARVLWGRCWEAGGAPAYWPWVQALRSYIEDAESDSLAALLGPRNAEVAQLLPELRERYADLPAAVSPDSEGARFRLFDATADFLKRAAAERPVVLVLDDLHAADTPSLLMLRFVAGEVAGSRLLVLGTYRDVEIGPDHPLDATLVALGREQTGHLIALGGLDEGQVSRLIAASSDAAPSRRVAAAIHRGTGGNPLFVEELVQLLVSENRLDDATAEASARAIPRGVHEVIGRRLETISLECRRALGVAAVLGRDFDLGTLAEVTGRPPAELLELLDEATSERIVTETAGMPGRLRFSHVLIRDVLYGELGVSGRHRLHARAAEALEALHASDPGPNLAAIAYHFYEAGPTGDPAKALDYARRAGDHAASQLAYEEAARHYELGIRVLRTAGRVDEPARLELLVALAESRLRSGEEEDARATFLAAADLARELDDAEALGRAALGYGGVVVWPAARGDLHLVPLLEDALGRLPESDSALRARLMARLACAVRDQPDRERGLPLSAEAVEIARRLGEPRTLAYTLDARCILITDPGSMESFAETALEVVALAEGIGELERAFTGTLYLVCSRLRAGDVAGARHAQEAARRHGEDLRIPTYEWGSAEIDAALALFEGRFDAAEELIETAFETGRDAQHFNAVTAHELQRFVLHRERGGLERCEEGLREAAERWPTYHILHSALASLYMELGRADDARAIVDALAPNEFERVYFDEEFLASMTLLAEVCVALGDREHAATIQARLHPHSESNAVGMIEIVLGSVARPVGLLAGLLGRADEAIGLLGDAVGHNERMGARPWVAHSKLDLARAVRESATGAEEERAASLLEEALGEYRALGMAPWEQRAARALEEARAGPP